MSISIRKLFPSGAWQCSAIIRGYLVTRTYYFYSRREAIAQFRRECI